MKDLTEDQTNAIVGGTSSKVTIVADITSGASMNAFNVIASYLMSGNIKNATDLINSISNLQSIQKYDFSAIKLESITYTELVR